MSNKVLIKSLPIILSIAILLTTDALGQQFTLHTTISNPDGGFNGYSSDLGDEIAQQRARQYNANLNMQYSDYRRGVAQFDRRLILSTNVVHKMDINKVNASKYPYANALYKKSLNNYKQLEVLSQNASANAKQNKSIKEFQIQEDKIIEKALDDYHKAEDLVELGERQDKILDEEAQNVMIKHNLTSEEKTKLKELTKTIKEAESKIATLNKNTDPLKREAKELEKLQTYQFIAQQLVTEAKIVEKAIALINPDKNSTRAITLTQTIVEKYLEEYYENGKSPAAAISEAFQKGYQKFERDELLKAVTPLKDISRVPLLIEDVVKEIDKWNKVDKNQMAVLNKINEVLEFTNDGIQRQQKIIDRSMTASRIIINAAIKRHLNKKTLL